MDHRQKGVEDLKKNTIWNLKAKKYANDKNKTGNLIKRALNKANKKQGILADVWDNIQLLFGLVGDWSKGKYTEVPIKTIIMLIASIVYFVSPVDAIPDLVPVAGFLDDAGVLAFVLESFKVDIEKYAIWKKVKSSELEIIDVTE